MKNKLTILVEEKNIRFAKKYAREINTSVSFLLNQFLEDLQQKTARKKILQKMNGWRNTPGFSIPVKKIYYRTLLEKENETHFSGC